MKQFLPTGSELQQTRQAQPAEMAPAGKSQSFVDNRPEALAQRKLKETIHASPKMVAQRKLTAELNNTPRMVAQRKLHAFMNRSAVQLQAAPGDELLQGKFEAVQRVEEEEPLQEKFATAQRVEEPLQRQAAEEEELLQGKFKPVQKMELDEEELVQGKFATTQLATGHEKEPPQRQPNNTGLPDNLKSGIENLSGYAMDDVKVHYNSAKPAAMQAHAYAQGTDIHLGPGQEKHLPHEAWHVIQQKQGRVKPTTQMKGQVNVNDDVGLEKEADMMGAKATELNVNSAERNISSFTNTSNFVIQGVFYKDSEMTSSYNSDSDAPWFAKIEQQYQDLFWEYAYEDKIKIYIPEEASKEIAQATIQKEKDRQDEIARENDEIERRREEALIQGKDAEELANAVAKENGGINVVGTAYSNYRPTQEHINWGKVKEYVSRILKGENFTIEINKVGDVKHLQETHHRFVAYMLTGHTFEEVQTEQAIGLKNWSSVKWENYFEGKHG